MILVFAQEPAVDVEWMEAKRWKLMNVVYGIRDQEESR